MSHRRPSALPVLHKLSRRTPPCEGGNAWGAGRLHPGAVREDSSLLLARLGRRLQVRRHPRYFFAPFFRTQWNTASFFMGRTTPHPAPAPLCRNPSRVQSTLCGVLFLLCLLAVARWSNSLPNPRAMYDAESRAMRSHSRDSRGSSAVHACLPLCFHASLLFVNTRVGVLFLARTAIRNESLLLRRWWCSHATNKQAKGVLSPLFFSCFLRC